MQPFIEKHAIRISPTCRTAKVFPRASLSIFGYIPRLAYRYLDRADKTSASSLLDRLQKAPFDEGDTREYRARSSIHNTRLVSIFLSSSIVLSLSPSFFSILSTVHGLRSFPVRWDHPMAEREKKERTEKKREGHDRRWCAPSTRITGLRRDQDLSFWCWSDGRMDENRPDGSHTPLNWSIRKSWWSLGGSARAFTIDRVRIFILPIFTPRPNSQEYNIRLIRKFRLSISHVYF